MADYWSFWGTALTAAVTLFLGVAAWRLSVEARRAEAYRAVHALYDKMVERKFEHPEFLIAARDWDPDCMRIVLDAHADGHQIWAGYYTFVELCIGFVNAVQHAHLSGAMGSDEYFNQWERLVRLVVAEHYPILISFAHEETANSDFTYLSTYLRNYISLRASEGWDWAVAHEQLGWIRAGQQSHRPDATSARLDCQA